LRVDLGDFRLDLVDEGGTGLTQEVARQMGDPLVRRPDGGVTYQLAVVVDDAAAGVTRVVRGRDIATSTATQAALFDLLGLPRPVWRHHLLLLEPRGGKLAKLHQSVSVPQLQSAYQPSHLVGFLAHTIGLAPSPEPVPLASLLGDFDWARVGANDVVVAWDGRVLTSWLT
jgi:glutamyl/glutaminyl-tRNA synthetase